MIATTLAALRKKSALYLFIAGVEPEPGYKDWLAEVLPHAKIMVFPGSGHFPQLARFASLATTDSADWSP